MSTFHGKCEIFHSARALFSHIFKIFKSDSIPNKIMLPKLKLILGLTWQPNPIRFNWSNFERKKMQIKLVFFFKS